MKFKNQKLLIFSSAIIYLLLQIGFFVSFVTMPKEGEVVQFYDKTIFVPLFFSFSLFFSIIFSSLLYWKYKKNGDNFYLTFSYLSISWSVISQMFFFQIMIGLIFAIKFLLKEKTDFTYNDNENKIMKKNLIFRSITNLLIILTIIVLGITWWILKKNENWFMFLVMASFVSQIFLRMIINQVIDWMLANPKNKLDKKILIYLIITTALGQFWYPIKLSKNKDQSMYHKKTAKKGLSHYMNNMSKEKRNLLIIRIFGLIISLICSALFIATVVFSVTNFKLEYEGQNPGFSTELIALMATQIVLGTIDGIIILTSKYKNKIVFGVLTMFISIVALFFWIFPKSEEPKTIDSLNNNY